LENRSHQRVALTTVAVVYAFAMWCFESTICSPYRFQLGDHLRVVILMLACSLGPPLVVSIVLLKPCNPIVRVLVLPLAHAAGIVLPYFVCVPFRTGSFTIMGVHYLSHEGWFHYFGEAQPLVQMFGMLWGQAALALVLLLVRNWSALSRWIVRLAP
jgi:hypothetical protein